LLTGCGKTLSVPFVCTIIGTVDTALSLAQTREEMMEELRPYSSSSRFKHAYNSSYSKRVAFLARAFCLTKPNIKSKLSTSRIGRASFNHSMLREEQEVNVSGVETNSNLNINAVSLIFYN
jgi:hypothetical protein